MSPVMPFERLRTHFVPSPSGPWGELLFRALCMYGLLLLYTFVSGPGGGAPHLYAVLVAGLGQGCGVMAGLILVLASAETLSAALIALGAAAVMICAGEMWQAAYQLAIAVLCGAAHWLRFDPAEKHA